MSEPSSRELRALMREARASFTPSESERAAVLHAVEARAARLAAEVHTRPWLARWLPWFGPCVIALGLLGLAARQEPHEALPKRTPNRAAVAGERNQRVDALQPSAANTRLDAPVSALPPMAAVPGEPNQRVDASPPSAANVRVGAPALPPMAAPRRERHRTTERTRPRPSAANALTRDSVDADHGATTGAAELPAALAPVRAAAPDHAGSSSRAQLDMAAAAVARSERAFAPQEPERDTLAIELELLRGAQAALQSAQPQRALALLERHSMRFPKGVLRQERMAAYVSALCMLGRIAEAEAAARQLAALAPASPHLPKLRESCARAVLR